MFEEQVDAINKIKAKIYEKVEEASGVEGQLDETKDSYKSIVDQFFNTIPYV